MFKCLSSLLYIGLHICKLVESHFKICGHGNVRHIFSLKLQRVTLKRCPFLYQVHFDQRFQVKYSTK